MIKTKEHAGYKLPEKCCASCSNSVMGYYPDNIHCNRLACRDNKIDLGGVCSFYEKETHIKSKVDNEGVKNVSKK